MGDSSQSEQKGEPTGPSKKQRKHWKKEEKGEQQLRGGNDNQELMKRVMELEDQMQWKEMENERLREEMQRRQMENEEEMRRKEMENKEEMRRKEMENERLREEMQRKEMENKEEMQRRQMENKEEMRRKEIENERLREEMQRKEMENKEEMKKKNRYYSYTTILNRNLALDFVGQVKQDKLLTSPVEPEDIDRIMNLVKEYISGKNSRCSKPFTSEEELNTYAIVYTKFLKEKIDKTFVNISQGKYRSSVVNFLASAVVDFIQENRNKDKNKINIEQQLNNNPQFWCQLYLRKSFIEDNQEYVRTVKKTMQFIAESQFVHAAFFSFFQNYEIIEKRKSEKEVTFRNIKKELRQIDLFFVDYLCAKTVYGLKPIADTEQKSNYVIINTYHIYLYINKKENTIQTLQEQLKKQKLSQEMKESKQNYIQIQKNLILRALETYSFFILFHECMHVLLRKFYIKDLEVSIQEEWAGRDMILDPVKRQGRQTRSMVQHCNKMNEDLEQNPAEYEGGSRFEKFIFNDTTFMLGPHWLQRLKYRFWEKFRGKKITQRDIRDGMISKIIKVFRMPPFTQEEGIKNEILHMSASTNDDKKDIVCIHNIGRGCFGVWNSMRKHKK